ncbi:MAG: hypothetical protein R2854_09770 [Caldilineaceae bacterium]
MAQQVTEITAISNFVSAGGAAGMLIVWSIDGALVIGLTAAQSLVVDRSSRLLVGAPMLLLALAPCSALAALLAQRRRWSTMLFLVSEQQWLVFPLVLWLLAGDIFIIWPVQRFFLLRRPRLCRQIVGHRGRTSWR